MEHKPNSSEHRLVARECPQCHIVKEFPARNKFCGSECSYAHQRGDGKGATDAASSPSESHEISGDNWSITLSRTRIHTLKQLLAHFEVDVVEWEVERFLVNKWEIGRKDKNVDLSWHEGKASGAVKDTGKIFVEPLYQVKAWLKRKVLQKSIREEIEELRNEARSIAPKFRPIKRVKIFTGNMLELSIPDLHIGKLAWGQETGWHDYDVRTAEQLFDTAAQSLIERTKLYGLEEICIIIGNDLLHVDNPQNTTTAGTSVSTDSRFHKTFRIARQMNVRVIEILRQIAPIRAIVIPGNHDSLSTWHLGDSLECYFHQYKDVKIENEPTPRKYYQWGKVMLMWTHHAQAKKRDDYPLLMATEQPEMFGQTIFREIHTGDLHQVRLEEKHGIRVRILPSLSAVDDWHSEHGFVGNVRSAEAYVWNKSDGLIGTAVYSIPDQLSNRGYSRSNNSNTKNNAIQKKARR